MNVQDTERLKLPRTAEELTFWSLEYSGKSFFQDYVKFIVDQMPNKNSPLVHLAATVESREVLSSWVGEIKDLHGVRVEYQKSVYSIEIYVNGVHVTDA